jgi:membrane-associated protease RseP (regulator of RpoE activity)
MPNLILGFKLETEIKIRTEEIKQTHDLAQYMANALIGLADVTAVFASHKEILLKGDPIIALAGRNSEIESRLSYPGYRIEVISTEPTLVVRMSVSEAVNVRRFPWVNLLLFILTGISTILAGAFWEGIDIFSRPGFILENPMKVIAAGLPFSLSLLAILLFHEFGHYIAGRLHRVNMTLPYFIPAPTIIGTFGAFIRSKSAFLNRRQLLDVAVAGPLAGLVVAIFVLAVGTRLSPVVPIPDGVSAIYFGDSLLHQAITYLVKGPIPDGQALMLNSVAFAGWVGILVTMFNLLPIGQLDGGHIMYALFGKAQKYLAYLAMLGLLALSFWWSGWAFWLLLTILMRPIHPPTLLDEVPLGSGRRFLGYLSIAAFILCFMPVPVTYI